MANYHRSFLKWAGNKYHCLSKIQSCFPSAQRLIEPFGGSGVVFMNTNYAENILAEDNLDLVLLFQQLQQHGQDFVQYCQTYFCPQNNQSEAYYTLRNEFNLCPFTQPQKRAALFLYLNRHGYNGLCRYNSKGIYNVPFGLYVKPYFPEHEMLLFYKKSKSLTVMHRDFRETFALAQSGDFIYCDPPYAPREQASHFTNYTSKKFDETAQIELATLAEKAANQGIWVCVSNHDTSLTRQYYRKASIQSFNVIRQISCFGAGRRPVAELLATFKPL